VIDYDQIETNFRTIDYFYGFIAVCGEVGIMPSEFQLHIQRPSGLDIIVYNQKSSPR